MARSGRPVESVGEDLPEVVREWTKALRAIVFQPLMSGEHPLKLKDIAEWLQQMTPAQADGSRPGTAGAQRLTGLLSGRGETSVQRMQSGRLVPTRDVVFDLLRLVEDERGAPGQQDLHRLWAAYKPALRERLPDVYAGYQLLDAYVSVHLLAEMQQRQLSDLQHKAEQDSKRLTRSEVRAGRAQQTALVLRRALSAAGHEARGLAQRERLLQQSVQQLSATVAFLEQDVARAQTAVQDWQEQTAWLHNLREQTERDALLNSEAWAEREGLLLERLAQAYETLEGAAVQAEAVEAELTARQEHWQQQATSAQAEARTAREEADTARRQAAAARTDAETVKAAAQRTLLEQQAAFRRFAAQAVAHHEWAAHSNGLLKQQLLQAKSDLRQAQADAVRADTQLSAFLRERDLMGALDEIVSHALTAHETLRSRELSRFDATPAANESPSSDPTTAGPAVQGLPDAAAVAYPPDPGTPERAPLSEATSQTAYDGDVPPASGKRLPASRHHRAAPRDGGPGRERPRLRIRWGRLTLAAVTALAILGGTGYALWTYWPGHNQHHNASPGSTPTATPTPSRSPSASTTPPPSRPAKDPVADIGDQDANTAAVMNLSPCEAGDVTASLRSGRNVYASTEEAHFALKIAAAEGGRMPCRVDTARSRVAITATAADTSTVLWDSSACTTGNQGHRWIKVTRTAPAVVDFSWDSIPNSTGCGQKTHAAGGTYLVEAEVFASKTQTSFVLLSDSGSNGGSNDGIFGGPTR